MPIVTLSRQMASYGDEIASMLAQRQGFALITRGELLNRFLPGASAHEQHMLAESSKYYLKEYKKGVTYMQHLSAALHEFAEENSAVLVGFGSQVMFADDIEALHIRITAPMNVRVVRIRRKYRISAGEAESLLLRADRKQRRFVRTVYNEDLEDLSHYHLVLNTALLSSDECVASVTAMLRERELELKIKEAPGEAVTTASEPPVFKNDTEAEFAKLLDMYNIEWKYEPKTFPIEWDAEGNVVKAFSPDFYLTKFDTYIELTAMNQKYVTEKNRKLRRMRELYPGTNVRIVYKKDFNSLVERFNLGKEASDG